MHDTCADLSVNRTRNRFCVVPVVFVCFFFFLKIYLSRG